MSNHTPGPWQLGKGYKTAHNHAVCAELLDALITMVRRVERDNLHTTKGWDLTRARAAIAKAKGGTDE